MGLWVKRTRNEIRALIGTNPTRFIEIAANDAGKICVGKHLEIPNMLHRVLAYGNLFRKKRLGVMVRAAGSD